MVSFMKFTSSIRINPAYAAALALVIIQVSVGILFKAAQSGGQYTFSASSSVTISEFLKFLLAAVLFYRECVQKHAADSNPWLESAIELDDEEKQVSSEGGEDEAFLQGSEKGSNHKPGLMTMSLKTYYRYVMDELPSEAKYGFAFLALFYVLINNTVFLLYKLSDPGTIQLIKSGTTLITAVVSMFLLGTKITSGQWIAISLQVCGIVVTQYKPTGAQYSLGTYLVLLFQTTVSAIASVYNQKLCKSSDSSMHVMNMFLYAAGAVINLILHIITRMTKPDEPGFFTGYGNIGAVMVIISNVFIGLTMTAVYKYADAIIKCFATAISTGILLYISPLLFGVDLSFLVVPGTSVVFIATWLYMEATPRPSSSSRASTQEAQVINPSQKSLIGKIAYMFSPHGQYKHIGLGVATIITLIIISSLTLWQSRNAAAIKEAEESFALVEPIMNVTEPVVQVPVLESPFKNTLAYVRWNSKHPERIPLIRKGYEPFFHTMHYSMPEIVDDEEEFLNMTHDSWEDGTLGYRAVKNTMKTILSETSDVEITGMFFFHFDVWVDPLGFADMDFDKIWFPDSSNPVYKCMNSTGRYNDWWGWGEGLHEKSLQASRLVGYMHENKYTVDPEEWCVGWSDIYYIPRRFFLDFIKLSEIFLAVPVFHEIAIPTILEIIDKTYEKLPSRSLITRLGDCWGDCCASSPTIEDVIWKRCGHRLDLQDKKVSNAHFRHLKQNSLMLGTPFDFYGNVVNATDSRLGVNRTELASNGNSAGLAINSTGITTKGYVNATQLW